MLKTGSMHDQSMQSDKEKKLGQTAGRSQFRGMTCCIGR